MTTQTKQLWQATDPESGLEATISFNYDDALLRILSFTITNPTTKTLNISATSTSNGKNYSLSVSPNTNSAVITINNQNAQNRLNVTVTPSGKIDGVEYSITFG